MSSKPRFLLLLLTTILAGLLAGFFYTWSFTIMQSLNLIGESNAATAMVSINANIRSGWFAAIFFGAPVFILLSLIAAWREKKKIDLWLSLAFIFAIATLVITFSIHLPLNTELANGLNWSSYMDPWVMWNHVRMLTSLLAFISMLYVMALYFKFESAEKRL